MLVCQQELLKMMLALACVLEVFAVYGAGPTQYVSVDAVSAVLNQVGVHGGGISIHPFTASDDRVTVSFRNYPRPLVIIAPWMEVDAEIRNDAVLIEFPDDHSDTAQARYVYALTDDSVYLNRNND